MRVTLTQNELFEAIASHLKGKLNLDDNATIEISFTAGRSPKGYTADVEITYPTSATAQKFIAKDSAEDSPVDGGGTAVASVEVAADPTAGGAVNPTNLFGS